MARAVSTFLFTLLVWLGVTWSVEPVSLAVGIGVSLLCAVGLRRIELEDAPLLLMPHRLFWAVVYLPVLFLYVVGANLDVAYRVLHPWLPIRPGIVKVQTSLKSLAGRVLLANSITLTPGTLSVDVVGDVFYIHCIAIPATGSAERTRGILARFEWFIRRIFE